ncbi:MAG: ABC transporter permease [Caldilineaceae bacterium]
MKAVRYSNVAWESIMANKLRSLLTMLGLIIGVASVLTTIGIGRGAALRVNQTIEGQGLNTLVISPNTQDISGSSSLTSGDARALGDPQLHPEIIAVASANSNFLRIVNGDTTIESQVTGATVTYATVRNFTVERGRFFTAEEEAAQQRVIVLSSIAARELFKGSDPLGQSVRINNEPFAVIGVLSKSSGDESEAYFRPVYVPLDVAQNRLFNATRYRGEYRISEIMVQVKSRDLLKYAETQVEQTLRLRHDLQADQKNDFNILNQARLLEIAGSVSKILTVLLTSIGTVSLLVGGIGIMNIMLVSVTERTSEIGLRKALGAQDQDILLQFLIEALVLCAMGSLMGIGLSYAVSGVINSIPDFPFNVVLEVVSILLALGVGLICGFVFGLYPAIRATRLDPIDALRYE